MTTNKMKKILFTMHSMPVGGAERVLVDILNNIDYEKYQVSLLLRNLEGGMLQAINSNVKILSIEGPVRRTMYTRIRNRIYRLLKIDDIIEKKKTRNIVDERYDSIVSFCQGTGHKLHSYITDLADKNISWVHSDLSKGNWGLSLFHGSIESQERAYNDMDTIVFVSNGAKDAFNTIFKVKDSINQLVFYNIVDKHAITQKAKELSVPRDYSKSIFINVGRLVAAKQQIRLLDAAQILKKQNYQFEIWILGDGPLRVHLETYIIKNDLLHYVKLMGNQVNPFAYTAVSDAFVLSSCQEGYPMVVCEALCLGIPVISTDIVGPREVLNNGEYGLMVGEESQELANAMILFMNDKNTLEYYKSQASKRSEIFSISEYMKSFYSIV